MVALVAPRSDQGLVQTLLSLDRAPWLAPTVVRPEPFSLADLIAERELLARPEQIFPPRYALSAPCARMLRALRALLK